MKTNLRTRLALSIAAVSLALIAFISLLSSYFINQQFKLYMTRQQDTSIREIIDNLSAQYDESTQTWNAEFVHTIGMYALYDGYIIKVYDQSGQTVWDAETWDMSACIQLKEDITHVMMTKYPQSNGSFTSEDRNIQRGTMTIGSVNLTYFGPYFYSDNDFEFLRQLSDALLIVASFSLLISILVGFLIAKRISRPILSAIDATALIARGDYDIRIQESSPIAEVDQLIESVNHLADSLDQQESLKKQLTSDVAHELRTPLTTLQTFLEAMLEGVWEPTAERLQSCQDEVARITNLVKDLENLATVENGTLKLEKSMTDMVGLVGQSVNALQMQVAQKNMTVEIRGTCDPIYVDRNRIGQVVINLLTNAIKYTPESGKIIIELNQTEDTMILNVIDNGSGIPQEELPLIFERFYRADKSRNRETGGSGIGLTIAKSIVETHAGTIEVQSVVDQGSTFTVKLPR